MGEVGQQLLAFHGVPAQVKEVLGVHVVQVHVWLVLVHGKGALARLQVALSPAVVPVCDVQEQG